MYTNQIYVILSCDQVTSKYFRGVFACDKIKNLCIEKSTEKYFIIVNTHSSKSPGQHWLLFFVVNNTCILFDSMAKSLSFYGDCVKDGFHMFSNNCNVQISSARRLQAFESNLCGIYCIYVARELCRKKSINMIENCFSNDHTKNDKRMTIWFSKYIKKLFPIKLCYKSGQFCTCEKKWSK